MIPSIAIIGAGFSGTVLCARLLRQARQPLRIVLINRSGRMARGTAYGTRSPTHVLNVPAGRMSALPENEDSFVNFCRKVDPSVVGGSFVSRSLYGDYLEHLLDTSEHAAAEGVTLERVVGEAVDLSIHARQVAITLNDGQILHTDRAVLASGNYAPANPPIGDPAFYGSLRYIRDPWSPSGLECVQPDDIVLMLGTGLTMFDVALELNRRGVNAVMHAISRSGLLPQPHRSPSLPPSHDHLPPDLLTGPATALHYLRSVRRHVKKLAPMGVDWRDVLASLRPITPALWQRLGASERARFVQRLRRHWDIHRHRAAPEIFAAVQALIENGRLRILAGHVRAYRIDATGAEASISPRNAATPTTLRAAWVINCTGPDSNAASIRDPLLQSLRNRGIVRIDTVGLGLETADDYALLSAAGNPHDCLRLLGPLLKGKFWEATAVPELRLHAAKVAELLLREVHE